MKLYRILSPLFMREYHEVALFTFKTEISFDQNDGKLLCLSKLQAWGEMREWEKIFLK